MKNTLTRWMTVGALAATISAGAFAQTAKSGDAKNISCDGTGSGAAATSSADDQVYILVPVPSALAQRAIEELQQGNQLPQSDQLQQDDQDMQQKNQQRNQEIRQEDKAWDHSLLGIYG